MCIVRLCGFTSKNSFLQKGSFHQSNRSKIHPVSDITNCPYAGYISAGELIHLESPSLVKLNTNSFQIQPF
nr:hypothetical protein Iba_scaffold12737CG0040 [Ipomoea batatas]